MTILSSALVGEDLDVHEAETSLRLVDIPLRQCLKGVLPNGGVISTDVDRVEVTVLLLDAQELGTEASNGSGDELTPGDVLIELDLCWANVDELLEVLTAFCFGADPDPVGKQLRLIWRSYVSTMTPNGV